MNSHVTLTFRILPLPFLSGMHPIKKILTVVVHFSPPRQSERQNLDAPPLLAPPTEGKTWTPETDGGGTKVNDHGKDQNITKNSTYQFCIFSQIV